MATNGVFGVFIGAAGDARGFALCAVRRDGARYDVLAWHVGTGDVDAAIGDLRRDIAALMVPEPEPAFVYEHERTVDTSREWREAREEKEQREQVATAQREVQLERIGSAFVVKADGGDLLLARAWTLMRSGRLRGANRDTGVPLEWIQRALEQGAGTGVRGLALSRALAAADEGG